MIEENQEELTNEIAFLFGAGADPICFTGDDFTKEFLTRPRETLRKFIIEQRRSNVDFGDETTERSYQNYIDRHLDTRFSTFYTSVFERTLDSFVREHVNHSSDMPGVYRIAKFTYTKTRFMSLFPDIDYDTIEEFDNDDKNDLRKLAMMNPKDKSKDKSKDINLKCLTESLRMELLSKELINYGTIERNFHTIINPKQYGQAEFLNLLYAYWKAHYATYQHLERLEKNLLFPDEQRSKKLSPYKYENVLGAIDQMSSNLKRMGGYRVINNDTENHHIVLVNEPDESKTIQVKLSTGELYYDYPWIKQSSGVITTNYTPCVEWFNVDCDKIAYVHGKLSWFEFPFSLEVVDCIRQEEYFNTLRESGQIYFPFLMATSSIKPIIHPLQMKEYHRAQSILDRSKTLVCIGHGLSGDDIHITTMIRLWLIQRKDRRFLYCSYNTADDEVEKINIQIHEKLCLPLNSNKIIVLPHSKGNLLLPQLDNILANR